MEVKFEANDPEVMARCSTPTGGEVLVVTAPSSSIDDEIGPVILPGLDSDNIVVVFSEEYVMSMAPHQGDSKQEVAEKMRLYLNIIDQGVEAGLQWMAEQ
jgi:hypothetical protein